MPVVKAKDQSMRHEHAVSTAVKTIMESGLSDHVTKIILFGSCARGEQTFSSDVDLLVLLDPEVRKKPSWVRSARKVASELSFLDRDLAECDVHWHVGKENEIPGTFGSLVRLEGKTIWET